MAGCIYYGVDGRNGFAVMSSWDWVRQVRKYVHHANTHKFYTFAEAEYWTLKCAKVRFPYLELPTSLEVNKAVFVKDLKLRSDLEVNLNG